jgi:hypothetical protein
MQRPTVLLINPYIYDFTAYDLWSKPLGLLYLGALLAENGCALVLLDAMDRWHPDVLAWQKQAIPKSKATGDGHFYREKADKPALWANIKRYYCRYGMPPSVMAANLEKIAGQQNIALILVTSGMSYWYQGAHEAIALCRQYFPHVKIVLGGIYATLYPQHAIAYSGADQVVVGEGEETLLALAREWLSLPVTKKYAGYDDYPWPAYQLYPKLDYVAMLTSRGCPFRCPFCATHQFTKNFARRNPCDVMSEIEHYVKRNITNIAFYDDALFVAADEHIKPILRNVAAHGWRLAFHTPNGLFARLLDVELAELMVASGFKTVRLSYESKNQKRQRQMGKVNDCDLAYALANLCKAGFPRHEVMVYLLMGLPDQLPLEVEESLHYVHSLGAKVSLSLFSPIPGTAEWETSVQKYGLPPDEPLASNKAAYPLQNPEFPEAEFDRLKQLAVSCNRQLGGEASCLPE